MGPSAQGRMNAGWDHRAEKSVRYFRPDVAVCHYREHYDAWVLMEELATLRLPHQRAFDLRLRARHPSNQSA